MTEQITRRAALQTLLTAAAIPVALPALGAAAAAPAADRPHVAPTDPTATALGYNPDATKVDAKANPSFKPGSNCANCAQNTGPAGAAWLGCNLFPNKAVSAGGWCRVWVKKPG